MELFSPDIDKTVEGKERNALTTNAETTSFVLQEKNSSK